MDVEQVLSVLALPPSKRMVSFQFFLIETSWFRQAYPFLYYTNHHSSMDSPIPATWRREDLGRISNRGLKENVSLHPTDFVLVGQNVWEMLRNGFHSNQTKSFPLQVQHRMGKWVVVLSEKRVLEIPPVGYFAYAYATVTADEDKDDNEVATAASASVANEEQQRRAARSIAPLSIPPSMSRNSSVVVSSIRKHSSAESTASIMRRGQPEVSRRMMSLPGLDWFPWFMTRQQEVRPRNTCTLARIFCL